MRLRVLVLIGLGVGLVLVSPPALAEVSNGCTGAITIDGVSYGPGNDSPGNPIDVPDRPDVVAEWFGNVPFANTNFHGEVRMVVGPAKIRLAEWSGVSGALEARGVYSRVELDDALPPGIELHGLYELTGSHEADGGRCDGRVMVRFGGNPLGSVVGLVSIGGLGLSAVGLVAAAFGKGA